MARMAAPASKDSVDMATFGNWLQQFIVGHWETSEAESDPVQLSIRQRAYFKWEAAGYPAGRDVEFWLAAERDYHKEMA